MRVSTVSRRDKGLQCQERNHPEQELVSLLPLWFREVPKRANLKEQFEKGQGLTSCTKGSEPLFRFWNTGLPAAPCEIWASGSALAFLGQSSKLQLGRIQTKLQERFRQGEAKQVTTLMLRNVPNAYATWPSLPELPWALLSLVKVKPKGKPRFFRAPPLFGTYSIKPGLLPSGMISNSKGSDTGVASDKLLVTHMFKKHGFGGRCHVFQQLISGYVLDTKDRETLMSELDSLDFAGDP